MISAQIVTLGAVIVGLLLLGVFMWPASHKLDGRQKYRHIPRPEGEGEPTPSISPFHAFFAMLFGQGAHANDSAHGDDPGGLGGNSTDGGGDGGGGGGGGDGGGD